MEHEIDFNYVDFFDEIEDVSELEQNIIDPGGTDDISDSAESEDVSFLLFSKEWDYKVEEMELHKESLLFTCWQPCQL